MDQARDATARNPSWWNASHTSGWDRAKEALRRDWEQTKADFSDGGEELNQDVDDTIKQVAGKQAIPPPGTPNPKDQPVDSDARLSDWNRAEPALRYGYGARQYYDDREWNADVEAKLRRDWDSTNDGSSTWDQVKGAVRRGWDSVKRAV